MPARSRALWAALLVLGTGTAWLADSSPPTSLAASTILTPTADATVQENLAASNLGLRLTLTVDSDFQGTGAEQWAYLMFDLGTPGPIAAATLRVYVTSPSVSRPTVSSTSTSWTEPALTWSSRPAPSGPVVSTTGAAAIDTWIDYDVTALLPTSGPASLVLQPVSPDGAIFSSRTGLHPPELIINNAPQNTTTTTGSTTTTSTSTSSTTTTSSTATTTPAPSGGDPRILAAGDIACDPASGSFNGGNGTSTACQQIATADLALSRGDAAALMLGDLQYNEGAYPAFLASYDPSWGRLNAIAKPAPGNHEYLTPGAAGYYEYFGAAAGDPKMGYYSYDIGTWHLIALNSNCGVVSCAKGSAQEIWLRSDLALHSARCTLVYWHHPLYSSGEHGNNPSVTALYQAAYDGGADVALAGHDHDYERFKPQDAAGQVDTARGLREFVVGTGGKSHYSIVTPKPNSEVSNDNTFGVLELTLHPGSYDWKFLPEPGKTFTDSGTQACH